MNAFIEKNRRLLKIYCIAARTIGWVLLITAVVFAVVKLFSGFSVDEQHRSYMLYLLYQQLTLSFVLLGLVLLGLAQFVRYLSESDYQPGWILRHGDKVLYLYAAILIISPVSHHYFQMTVIRNVSAVSFFLFFLSAELPAVAKGLIIIGIARILNRIVPIIEESKTLV